MAGHRQLVCEHAFLVLIHLLFQDHMNGLVVINAIVKPSSASHDQAFITYFAGEAKDTQAGLIRMRPSPGTYLLTSRPRTDEWKPDGLSRLYKDIVPLCVYAWQYAHNGKRLLPKNWNTAA